MTDVNLREQADRARAKAEAARKAADEAEAAVLKAESAREAARVKAERAQETARAEDAAPTESDGSAEPAEPAARSKLYTVGVSLLVTLVVGLAAVAVVLGLAHRDRVEVRDQEAAMIDATKAGILDLISLNKDTAEAGTQQILDRATGEWYDQIDQNRDAVASLVQQIQLVTSSTVDDVGIEKRNDDGSTSLLVAATSKVTNAAGAQDQVRPWRLRVAVADVDGEWKLAKVEFVV